MKKTLTAATLLGLMSGTAYGNLYGGLSYGFMETELGSADFDTPTLNFALGVEATPHLAVEGRLGLGVGDDGRSGVTVEIDDYFAVYVKPMLPLSDTVSLYGLLGVAETTVETNFGDDDDDDFSYGFGISAKTRQGLDLFAEYVSLYDDRNVEISGFNLGVNLRF